MDPLLLQKSGSVKTLSEDGDHVDTENEQEGIPSLSSLANHHHHHRAHQSSLLLHQEEEEQEETWRLRVKSFKQDVSILVRPSRDTVQAVKQAVRQALGPDVTRDRPYTRLVCKGRLLAPDAALLKDLTVVQPNDVVHAVLSAGAAREGPQAALQRGFSDVGASSTTSHNAVAGRRSTTNRRNHHNNNNNSSSSSLHGTASTAATTTTGPSRRAWRGAGINADGLAVRQTADSDTDDDDNDEDSVEDVETGGWMGFDRLRRAGLRRSDVLALRTYFGRSIDRFVRQNPEQTTFATENDPQRRRLLQEEAWMAAQGPLSEFRLNINPMSTAAGAGGLASGGGGVGGAAWNTNAAAPRTGVSPSEALWRSGGLSAAVGTDRDFIWGFLLGFLVGLLMLVWVWMPSVPHKQKLGILTGICFQLALSMMRTSSSGGGGEDPYPLYEGGDDYFFQN